MHVTAGDWSTASLHRRDLWFGECQEDWNWEFWLRFRNFRFVSLPEFKFEHRNYISLHHRPLYQELLAQLCYFWWLRKQVYGMLSTGCHSHPYWPLSSRCQCIQPNKKCGFLRKENWWRCFQKLFQIVPKEQALIPDALWKSCQVDRAQSSKGRANYSPTKENTLTMKNGGN